MKKVKKILALCLMLVLAMSIFAACGSSTDLSGSPYCGSWAGTKAEYGGLELTMEEMGMTCSLSLEANGKAAVDFDGDSETGKWEETENGILLKDSSDEMELIAEDGSLTLEMEGMKLYFEKQ